MGVHNHASDALLDSFAYQQEIIPYYGVSACALVKPA